MTVSEKIFEVMFWTGFNQKKLSEASGIPRSSLSSYLRDDNRLTIVVLRKIADALGVSLWTLINNEPLAATITPEDVTEEERHIVAEYRYLSAEERAFIDHAFQILNQKKKAK